VKDGVLEDRRGFVLPVIIFGLLLMGTMTVAALLTASDESRSGRAMREATEAFYAAEAGLNQVYAEWDSIKAAVDTMVGGSTLDLGWRATAGGGRYHAVVYRWDEGVQPVYQLIVEGRSAGSRGGVKWLSYTLTSGPGGPDSGYMLGECCDAAATVKGSYKQRGSPDTTYAGFSVASGYDTHPPGWGGADVCADELYDKPGLIMADTTLADLDLSDGLLEGVPPLVQDPTITDAAFDSFGPYSWQDVKDRADIVIDPFMADGCVYMAGGGTSVCDMGSGQIKLEADEVYPRYNGDGTCDTSHPLNWGSDDPDDPCFNHFPVILTKGEVEFRDADRFYGQGMIILDFDETAMTGAELEFETNAHFRGVTLGKGCIEVQAGAQYYGAIFLDATYDGVTCDKSADLYESCGAGRLCDETRLQWSQCAVDRAMRGSSLFDMAEATIPGESGGIQLLGDRAYGELFH
jgi:hypothetical protein